MTDTLRLACACTFCTIAPPHVLREIAARGNAEQRSSAERTLATTRTLRQARLQAVAVGAPPPTTAAMPAAARPAGARSTHDAGGTRDLPANRVRAEGAGPVGDDAVDEAHEFAGLTRDFLSKVFRRRSIDGRGLALVSTVHFDRNYDNAFWDGAQMVYGDGDGKVFNRFTVALEVVGHELAHGVTQYTSNLIYFEQPGALNEHFSDVIGSLVKQWHLGQDAGQADWLIGAGLLAPGIHGSALRSMSAPGTAYDDPLIGRDPQPAHMRDYHFGPEDQGGVHINSGIPNRVFWRVATTLGGPAWKTAGRIWWDAFTGMLNARATFSDAARATIAAAGEVGGQDALRAVRAAWAEAGVTVPRSPPRPLLPTVAVAAKATPKVARIRTHAGNAMAGVVLAARPRVAEKRPRG